MSYKILSSLFVTRLLGIQTSSLQKMLSYPFIQPTADNQRQTAIQVKRPLIVLHFLTRRYVYDTILGLLVLLAESQRLS